MSILNDFVGILHCFIVPLLNIRFNFPHHTLQSSFYHDSAGSILFSEQCCQQKCHVLIKYYLYVNTYIYICIMCGKRKKRVLSHRFYNQEKRQFSRIYRLYVSVLKKISPTKFILIFLWKRNNPLQQNIGK